MSGNQNVDVVVIGAGLGGMSVATRLAQKGMSVQLLERHNVPGGYATSFVRGRYEFEVALHELSGVGPEDNRGGVYHYLKSIGVAEQVDFVVAPTLYRSIFSDIDFTLTQGWQRAEADLCAAFPADATGIREFLALCRTLLDELEALRMSGLNKIFKPGNLASMPSKCPNLLRYNMAPLGPVLERFVKDPRARRVICQFWGYFGLPPSRCSFFFFAIGLASYIGHGAAYIKGRSQSLSNAFITALEGHGGKARLGCGARRIVVEGGKVAAVETDEGERIGCRFVVSNADPVATCRGLIGEQHVPQRWFQSLGHRVLGPGSVNVYLGVNRTAEELGLTDHEIFVNGSDDHEKQFRDCHGHGPATAVVVTCYNHVYPEISPPGTSMVVLTTLKFGKYWRNLRPADYARVKHKLADGMIDTAARVAPDLRRYAEAIEVSTPLTNVRYAGALGGSIYGFCPSPTSHTVWNVPSKGPVPGLYFCGAWTTPGGGFEPSIISGSMTAGQVLHMAAKDSK